ncbi:pkgB [Symbiodinium necroappetens]|uniref:non-specific serine/threonine protein kinase n=1 Tax=Symbiodinium necroappetens TaxID=1628268 RepID=A0A813BMH2_9DINO|nr:pkgB [Symbiodinium necroappetens]
MLPGSPSLDDFNIVKVIGKGSHGKVVLVRHKAEGDHVYAMKENVTKRNQVEHTTTEGKNVLEAGLYLILEYCPGGQLLFHLSRAGRFSEGRCRFYASEILLAIEYLHRLNLIFRDLKPENILLDAEGHVKLTDTGLSKVIERLEPRCQGTPEYLAPEILAFDKRGHSKAVDWYALGALMYEMLTGLPPFYTQDRDKLFEVGSQGRVSGESRVDESCTCDFHGPGHPAGRPEVSVLRHVHCRGLSLQDDQDKV